MPEGPELYYLSQELKNNLKINILTILLVILKVK